MKLKAVFLLFNAVLIASFLLIFLMPLFLLGIGSFPLFWGRNWIIGVVFLATLLVAWRFLQQTRKNVALIAHERIDLTNW